MSGEELAEGPNEPPTKKRKLQEEEEPLPKIPSEIDPKWHHLTEFSVVFTHSAEESYENITNIFTVQKKERKEDTFWKLFLLFKYLRIPRDLSVSEDSHFKDTNYSNEEKIKLSAIIKRFFSGSRVYLLKPTTDKDFPEEFEGLEKEFDFPRYFDKRGFNLIDFVPGAPLLFCITSHDIL